MMAEQFEKFLDEHSKTLLAFLDDACPRSTVEAFRALCNSYEQSLTPPEAATVAGSAADQGRSNLERTTRRPSERIAEIARGLGHEHAMAHHVALYLDERHIEGSRPSVASKCRTCKHWGEHHERPWAGSVYPPSERRRLEQLDERDCERMGGFASSGGFGKFPHFVDGDHMPRNEAYLMDHGALAKFVTCPDFGCVLWEAAE